MKTAELCQFRRSSIRGDYHECTSTHSLCGARRLFFCPHSGLFVLAAGVAVACLLIALLAFWRP
jgi:hypothetical protein